jgi:hypothetical protein
VRSRFGLKEDMSRSTACTTVDHASETLAYPYLMEDEPESIALAQGQPTDYQDKKRMRMRLSTVTCRQNQEYNPVNRVRHDRSSLQEKSKVHSVCYLSLRTIIGRTAVEGPWSRLNSQQARRDVYIVSPCRLNSSGS